jgi:hypothetical protein
MITFAQKTAPKYSKSTIISLRRALIHNNNVFNVIDNFSPIFPKHIKKKCVYNFNQANDIILFAKNNPKYFPQNSAQISQRNLDRNSSQTPPLDSNFTQATRVHRISHKDGSHSDINSSIAYLLAVLNNSISNPKTQALNINRLFRPVDFFDKKIKNGGKS